MAIGQGYDPAALRRWLKTKSVAVEKGFALADESVGSSSNDVNLVRTAPPLTRPCVQFIRERGGRKRLRPRRRVGRLLL